LWRNVDFKGTVWWYPFNTTLHNQWEYVQDGVNDRASSLWNNRAWLTAVNADYPATKGYREWCWQGGSGYYDLTLLHWGDGTSVNDSISSINEQTQNNNCPPSP
jgi:hypothetical protein